MERNRDKKSKKTYRTDSTRITDEQEMLYRWKAQFEETLVRGEEKIQELKEIYQESLIEITDEEITKAPMKNKFGKVTRHDAFKIANISSRKEKKNIK